MRAADCLLTHCLRAPERLSSLSEAEWDRLIRQGRRANLLARIAHLARSGGWVKQIPVAPRGHLIAAEALATRQVQAIRHELVKLAEAFASTGLQPVLLKGTAYLATHQPCAHGRLFGDIDLMVPKAQIGLAESTLMLHGWNAGHHDDYDQRYYRRWMHEVPPLQHVTRLSIVDLHHAILPETSRTPSPAGPLFENSIDVEGLPFRALHPVDMVLHSATHLFNEGEFHNGLRDLCDLDSLLREFSAREPDFWQKLETRAMELNLRIPLRHALKHCQEILGTPVPDMHYSFRPVDPLLARALAPEHPGCGGIASQLARGLLYVRGHWLRMPLHLLIPHLLHKSLAQPEDKTDQH